MKNIWVLGALSLAAAFFFAACQKHSSSSSASGSVSAAVGDLANLALSYSGVTPASVSKEQAKSSGHLQPKTFNTCAGISFNVNYNPISSASAGCPNNTDIAFGYSGTGETMAFSSCTSAGYTFDGTLSLGFGSQGETVCVNSAGSVDFLSGEINLTSSSMTITGNGVNQSNCSVNISLALSLNAGTPTGTASNANACGNTFSVTAAQ